jgi:mRNA-degrading endonuclease RelE of RelBE toxin-antitoxin system
MMAVNGAVEGLADDPAPPGAFVRGAYRRLRVGPYRVLYEVEGDLITIVRIDRV